MPKTKRVTYWMYPGQEKRTPTRFEVDIGKVHCVLYRNMEVVAEGDGMIKNVGEKGAYLQVVFPSRTLLGRDDHVVFEVLEEPKLVGFSAKAHIQFSSYDRTTDLTDLHLQFFEVTEESHHHFFKWRGHAENARHPLGRRHPRKS